MGGENAALFWGFVSRTSEYKGCLAWTTGYVPIETPLVSCADVVLNGVLIGPDAVAKEL